MAPGLRHSSLRKGMGIPTIAPHPMTRLRLPIGLSDAPFAATELAEGLHFHAAGQFGAAARCYKHALDANPNHPDILLLLGILARQTNQPIAATELLRAAIAALPAARPAAHFHLNLAHACHAAGELAQAQAACRRALALDPQFAAAHCRLAEILADRGDLEAAERCCRTALAMDPTMAHAHFSLGNVLCRRQQYAMAVASYHGALSLAPRRAEYCFGLGYALSRLDDLRGAQKAFLAALRLRPHFAEAHLNLGNLYYDHGQPAAAALHYKAAIELRPAYGKAIINLGNALIKLGRPSEAVSCYRQALQLEPESVAAQHGLGNALADSKDWLAAQSCLEQALARDPRSADLHNSLGNLHYSRKNMKAAAAAYRQAVELDSSYARAYVNLGNAVLAMGRHEEARSLYERGLALDPALPGARYNLALAQLRKGEFAEGWQNYESRWAFEELRLRRRHAEKPLWHGGPLQGKTILLHAEQGLGDTIQFVRFVPIVAAMGARVVLEVQPPLARLLTGFPGAAQVVERGTALPGFDLQCPLMSLPLALGTRVETIPAAEGYLTLPAANPSSRKTGPGALRLGLAWSGNPRNKGDANRSMPLAALLPLAGVPGLELISLQKGAGVEQLVALQDRLPIANAAASHADMYETARLVASLDAVLSVDTSIAHLAGAMGKPVWVMLPWVADWRWMKRRSTSPWYASARLLRQSTLADWGSVVEQLVAALHNQKR